MMIPVADDTCGMMEESDLSWSSETNRLLKAVSDESLETLESLLNKGCPVNGHGGAFHETPLHLAAQQGWTTGLKLLLSKGAHAYSVNQFGQTPLHYASASKASECVRSLLSHGCQASLDHKDMRGHTPLHDAASVGFPDGVVLHLKAGASVNVKDKNEETPLHKAARARCISSIIALLNRGSDIRARDKTGESVLNFILRQLPAGMDDLLDHCLVLDSKKNIPSKKLEVALNFIPIAGSTDMTQMKVLHDIVEMGHPKLLLHPVCEAFLLLKWFSVRRLFFIEVIFYFVHAILATILILDKFVWQRVRGTIPESLPYSVFHIGQGVVHAQGGLILFKQILTLIQGVRAWLFSFWHVLNSTIPILVFIVLPGPQTVWQHHISTMTLLLIWVQCMLHIGRFPNCGIYVAMFTRVAKVFVRIFLIFFCLLLAFSLSFYVSKYAHQYAVLGTDNPNAKMNVTDQVFSDPSMTFMKTLTMMIGELEFDSSIVVEMRNLPWTSHIIYLAFIILVSIILANLLVALAVNDVQGLRNSAHLERLIKQMELVFQMEKTFSTVSNMSRLVRLNCISRKIKKFFYDFPNIKVFVRPYHPQKSSKMIVIQGGMTREINLRKNHQAKLLDCVRLLQEESSTTDGKQLSAKKSRQVLSEYTSFANCEDDMCSVLQNIERNILQVLGEKVGDISESISSLSTRIRIIEEVLLKGDLEETTTNKGSRSGVVGDGTTSKHLYNPSIRRLQGRPRLNMKSIVNNSSQQHLSPGYASNHQRITQRHSYHHPTNVEDHSQRESSKELQENLSPEASNTGNNTVQIEMSPPRCISLPIPPSEEAAPENN